MPRCSFVRYGKSCGKIYFVTKLKSGKYRITRKSRNNLGQLITEQTKIMSSYTVNF